MLPVLGETALLVTDGEDHRRLRHHVLPAFHRSRIDDYVRLMAANTTASVRGWGIDSGVDSGIGTRAETTLDLYRVLRSVVRRNTVGALYGNRLAADSEGIGDRLQIALNSTDLPLGAQLFLVGVPNPLTPRAKRARRKVAARVQAEMDRRLMDGAGPDGLGALLSARSAESRPLNDAEVGTR
ncbi:cytochrome P450 [Streptomyces sp. NBC_01511]|uniref:hypothetical protein n=1 Tax=unclassified Streptomyces TaxID=2593676 RepID=UPI0038695FFE